MDLTRRIFLKDLGKFGVAAAVLTACGDDADEAATSSTIAGDENVESASATETESEGLVAADEAVVPLSGPAGAPTALRWSRAVLGSVSAYVLARGGEAVVFDTGNPGSASSIEAALQELSLDWDSVGHVAATHLHPDHIGSFADVMTLASKAIGYAGTADVEAISSPRPIAGLDDGARLFGFDVIGTPGHTPGHVCFLDRPAGILVAGDALNGTDGSGLLGPNEAFTPDMALANESVAKLAGFDYSIVLVGHGEPVLQGGASMVGDLAG